MNAQTYCSSKNRSEKNIMNKYEIYINDKFLTKRGTKKEYKYLNFVEVEYLVVNEKHKLFNQSFKEQGFSFSSKEPRPISSYADEIKTWDEEKLEKTNYKNIVDRHLRRSVMQKCQIVHAKAIKKIYRSFPINVGKNYFTDSEIKI